MYGSCKLISCILIFPWSDSAVQRHLRSANCARLARFVDVIRETQLTSATAVQPRPSREPFGRDVSEGNVELLTCRHFTSNISDLCEFRPEWHSVERVPLLRPNSIVIQALSPATFTFAFPPKIGNRFTVVITMSRLILKCWEWVERPVGVDGASGWLCFGVCGGECY